MMEVWNPLGLIGVITAFNFPSAVSGWNAAIALICGNLMLWKGATNASIVTIAIENIVGGVLKKNGWGSIHCVCQGKGSEVGNAILHDKRM